MCGGEPPLRNGQPAWPDHPASNGRAMREEAAGVATVHVPAGRRSIGSTHTNVYVPCGPGTAIAFGVFPPIPRMIALYPRAARRPGSPGLGLPSLLTTSCPRRCCDSVAFKRELAAAVRLHTAAGVRQKSQALPPRPRVINGGLQRWRSTQPIVVPVHSNGSRPGQRSPGDASPPTVHPAPSRKRRGDFSNPR
jgi:hypothetical protein